MQRKDLEKMAFLYLCSEKDRKLLFKQEDMKFYDFRRLLFLTHHMKIHDFYITKTLLRIRRRICGSGREITCILKIQYMKI